MTVLPRHSTYTYVRRLCVLEPPTVTYDATNSPQTLQLKHCHSATPYRSVGCSKPGHRQAMDDQPRDALATTTTVRRWPLDWIGLDWTLFFSAGSRSRNHHSSLSVDWPSYSSWPILCVSTPLAILYRMRNNR